jgi:hypothetical protein
MRKSYCFSMKAAAIRKPMLPQFLFGGIPVDISRC